MEAIMKVQCSNCKAVYQIDESKIPEKGAYATCPKCKTRFYIKKEPKAQKEEQQEEIIPCPNCGHLNISSNTCISCGKVFSRDESLFHRKKEPRAQKEEQQEIHACPFCYHLMTSKDICIRCGRIFLSEPRRLHKM